MLESDYTFHQILTPKRNTRWWLTSMPAQGVRWFLIDTASDGVAIFHQIKATYLEWLMGEAVLPAAIAIYTKYTVSSELTRYTIKLMWHSKNDDFFVVRIFVNKVPKITINFSLAIWERIWIISIQIELRFMGLRTVAMLHQWHWR